MIVNDVGYVGWFHVIPNAFELSDYQWWQEMVCRCSLPRWRLGCGAAYCPTPLPRVGAWWVRAQGGDLVMPGLAVFHWLWISASLQKSQAPKVEPSLLDFHHRARPQIHICGNQDRDSRVSIGSGGSRQVSAQKEETWFQGGAAASDSFRVSEFIRHSGVSGGRMWRIYTICNHTTG